MPDIAHQDKHTEATEPYLDGNGIEYGASYYCGTRITPVDYFYNSDGCYMVTVEFASGTKITVPVSVIEVKS